MFKKTIKVGAQNQLSGKDRKTMKTKLNTLFNEKCVQTIFNNNEKILSIKVSGSKMVLYNGEEYPLFVDGTGKNDYFPSVYTCEAYQTLLPFIHLNEGVENFIFNGANLMWPGVRSYAALGQFKKDQVVGIMNAKGQVVAIGAMGCSLDEFQKTQDKSGIAAYILHYKRDKLWDQGSKMSPQIIVPLGQIKQQQKPEEKVEQVVKEQKPKEIQQKQEEEKPKKKAQKKEQPKRQSSDQEIQEQKNKKKGKKAQKGQKQQKKQQIKKKASSQQEEDDDTNEADFMVMLHGSKKNPPPKVQLKKNVDFNDDDDDWDKKKKKQKAGRKKNKKHQEEEKPKKETKKKEEEGDSEQEQQEGEEHSAISTKIMDNYLKESFLNVLKLSKIQGQLPIDSGRFYMDYMLLARPQGVKLQIKQSSYKKISKFYEQMAKQKFIQFKHGKQKKGQQGSTISKIFYDNQQLKNFVPTVRKLGEKDVEVKEEDHSKVKLKLIRSLVVENVYKPNEELFDVAFKKTVNFNENWDEDVPPKKQEPGYFTQGQMKAAINKYIETIIENKVDKSDNKKEKKVEKQVLIDYKKNPIIQELLKKEIQDYEENLAAQQEAAEEMAQNSDEEEKAKKKKKKKQILKMDRQILINKLMKKSTTFHHVSDKENGIDNFKEGQFKGINIVAEKANNKNITKITGLETFIVPKQQADKQINAMASMFQQKFASSVNVQNLPGKNLGKEIIIHGAFIDQLEEYFINEHGIKKQYITTQNKLDKKKKK